MELFGYIFIFLVIIKPSMCQLPTEQTDAVSRALNALHGNPCEKMVNNKTQYYACSSEPLHLLQRQNANLNFSISPEDATCGAVPATYCTLGIRLCGICDQRSTVNQHPPEYMMDSQNAMSASGENTWWQSKSWTNYPEPLEVNITISFDHSYELQNDLIVKFHSSRPRHMILEKSDDFGQTWSVLQYYSKNCRPYYNTGVPSSIPLNEPDAVICSQAYSNEMPFLRSSVIFPVMDYRYRLFLGKSLTNFKRLYEAFNSTQLNKFLTFTDIRIRLLHPATNGKEVLRITEDLQRYYYAISDIEIVGGCSCNLHGKYCELVGGRTVCKCEHNTEGDNCERCQPLYRNRPWKPGFYLPYPHGTANECQKCECHNHADTCTYVTELSEGVCDHCQHNTIGVHCERCREGFFPNVSLPLDSVDICTRCDCEPLGVSRNNTMCDSMTGHCVCKELVRGRRCDMCTYNYYGLLLENSKGICKACDCDLRGTVSRSNLCDAVTGQCPCRETFSQRDCSQCKDGFYRLPSAYDHSDCLPCHCDPGGSTAGACDKTTGRCSCLPHIIGLHCTMPEDGFYVPSADASLYKPSGGSCQTQTALHSAAYPFTERHFVQCNTGQNVEFEPFGADINQPNTTWWYVPVIRYSLNGSEPWSSLTLEVYVKGGSSCPLTVGYTYTFKIQNLTPGIGAAWLSDTELSVDSRCLYGVILTAGGSGMASQPIMIDSFLLLPSLNTSRLAQLSDAAEMNAYNRCMEDMASLSDREEAMKRSDCLQYTFSIGSEMAHGAILCDCDETGTEPGTQCESFTGQCTCKPGVEGRRCDRCSPGYSRFTSIGCTACDCDVNGAVSAVCNYTTGQCLCHNNVSVAGLLNSHQVPSDLQCSACLRDHYGLHTGLGCQPCECSAVGSEGSQCDDFGQCPCKLTVAGQKCDQCEVAHFNLTADGCTLCGCNEAGSIGVDCHTTTGQCVCKANTMNLKCDTCRASTFNLAAHNPDGCQKCFCYGHTDQCSSATGFKQLLIMEDSVDDWEVAAGGTHVVAPQSFLGNRMHSYGQSIDILVHSRFMDNIPFVGESAVIFYGNGQLVYYDSRNFTIEGREKLLSISLHESFWYYRGTRQPNTAEFYSILADLSGIYIQRVFGHEIVEMRNITMISTTTAEPGDEQVNSVENCTCDPTKHVEGLSCENCSSGYWRSSASPKTNVCDLCQCSDRAMTKPPLCDPLTGQCLNCKVGTAGHDCSECATNVAGKTCNICNRFHWGLDKDGCKKCICSNVGSVHQQCNRRTGDCVCGKYVVGQSCSECRENYYGLVPTRCTKCGVCYSMLSMYIVELRDQRTNLTNLLAVVEQQQNTSAHLDPFTTRLNAAISSVHNLLEFLEANSYVNASVHTWISRLRSNHSDLLVRVHALSNMTEALVNGSLQMAGNTLQQAAQTINDTKQSLKQSVGDRAQIHSRYSWQLEDLVNSLRDAERRLQLMSESSDGNMLHAARLAQEVEALSAKANTLALPMLQSTEEAVSSLTRLQQSITELVQFVSRVDGAANWLSERAQWARENATLVEADVSLALSNATSGLQVSSNGLSSLHNRATAIRQQATVLQQQIAEAITIAQQTTVNRVALAAKRTVDLANQVKRLISQSDSLYQRASAAHEEAATAEQLEESTFDSAHKMVDVMSHFSDKAAEVEKQANVSLQTVERVRVLSEKATSSAESLRASLQSTHTMASSARTLAAEAVNMSVAIQQVNEDALTSAEQLKVQSDSLISSINSQVYAIDSLNSSRIQPAIATCSALHDPVAALRRDVTQAGQGAERAIRQTAETRARIDTLLRRIADTGSAVTASQVAELRQEVMSSRVDFDRRQLAETVRSLKATAQEQQSWLDGMLARKQQLVEQISRLKLLQQQVTAG